MKKTLAVIALSIGLSIGAVQAQNSICLGINCDGGADFDQNDIVGLYAQLGSLDFQLMNNRLTAWGMMNPDRTQCMIDCHNEYISDLALCGASVDHISDEVLREESLRNCTEAMRQKQIQCFGSFLDCGS
jgi:hypothetical protein